MCRMLGEDKHIKQEKDQKFKQLSKLFCEEDQLRPLWSIHKLCKEFILQYFFSKIPDSES